MLGRFLQCADSLHHRWAGYWLYGGGIWLLRTSEVLLMAAMKSSLSGLALLCFCLVSWTAAAETDKRHPAAIAPQSALLTFQTLDGAAKKSPCHSLIEKFGQGITELTTDGKF